MEPERTIIGAAIIAGGIASATTLYDGTFTPRIIIGAAGVAIILSLVAATGPGPAKIASGLAVLVATTSVLYYAVPFFGLFGAAPQGSTVHHQ